MLKTCLPSASMGIQKFPRLLEEPDQRIPTKLMANYAIGSSLHVLLQDQSLLLDCLKTIQNSNISGKER